MDVKAAWEVSVMGVGVRRKEHVAMMRHAHEDAMRLHPIVDGRYAAGSTDRTAAQPDTAVALVRRWGLLTGVFVRSAATEQESARRTT